jgi:hypothetical protein
MDLQTAVLIERLKASGAVMLTLGAYAGCECALVQVVRPEDHAACDRLLAREPDRFPRAPPRWLAVCAGCAAIEPFALARQTLADHEQTGTSAARLRMHPASLARMSAVPTRELVPRTAPAFTSIDGAEVVSDPNLPPGRMVAE